MKRLRIGIDCFLLQPHMGGMKQYFHTLVGWLLQNDLANDYVLLHYAQNVEELNALPSDRWKATSILLGEQQHVRQVLDKIDVYFCPFTSLWPRPLPKPTVVTMHDIQETRYPEFFSEKDRLTRAQHYPASSKMADRVITISEFCKREIVKHHRVSPRKVAVIHNAADERFYRAAEIGVPIDPSPPAKFAIYPANRWKHKNHEPLLQAIRLLRDGGVDVPLLLTGWDSPGQYPAEQRAKELGIADLVRLLGYVSTEQLAGLYAKATLLVFPSLYEGFGIPVVEALAAGCAIACANDTSLPEIAGEAAVYFDPTSPRDIANAMFVLWNEEKLRADKIALGRTRAKEFSVEKMAAAHLQVFRDAIAAFSPIRSLRQAWLDRFVLDGVVELRRRRGAFRG